ncbi:MAG TPA: DUF411 domain-containing protein [Stellaceae bacterium]|nr:DUF411 domain-containing protein [Stellaceae bacterium]
MGIAAPGAGVDRPGARRPRRLRGANLKAPEVCQLNYRSAAKSAIALKRLLAEKPDATGLAVPGIPVGSPGMEGGAAEPYEVVLFGPTGRRSFMRFP